VSAAKQAAAKSLRIDLGAFGDPWIETFQSNEGDILVARWTPADAGRPERAFWLWDAPSSTVLVTAVTPETLNPDSLPTYFENLLDWNRFINLSALKLFYLNATPGKEDVVGLGTYMQTERGTYWLGFSARADGGRSYVSIEMSKAIFAAIYPPAASEVPERFPPLRSRLATAPREALFAELGKGYKAPWLLTYPHNRDAIVMAELLSRGPVSDAEMRRIVIGNFNKGDLKDADVVNSRVGAFVGVLERAKQLSTYAPSIARVLLDAPVHPVMQGAVLGHLLGAAMRQNIDLSDAALTFLEHGQFIDISLHYLGLNSRDPDTLRKLSTIPLAPKYDEQKKIAIERIQRRIALSNRPRPPRSVPDK